MLRAIPLPDESVWTMKQRFDPLQTFMFRMRLWELDQILGVTGIDNEINEVEIEYLVMTNDWPEC